jgi:hypothetical protein
MIDTIISTLTSQLKANGVDQDQVQNITSQIKPENLGQMTTLLPTLLSGLNLPADKITSIIGNVVKDGFQISDLTDAFMGAAQNAGESLTDAKNEVIDKVEGSKNPLDMAKDILGGMFK